MIKKKNRKIKGLTLRQRFLNKIKISNNGCWEWDAAISTMGYGCIVDNSGTTKAAHRISYELYIGEIPKGFFICHKCDSRKCVNPLHLFLGTQQDNVDDMMNKGRHGNGYGRAIHPSVRHYALGCRCKECRYLVHLKYIISKSNRF